jgi:hypothetical protein
MVFLWMPGTFRRPHIEAASSPHPEYDHHVRGLAVGLIAVLAACGRLAFEPRGDGGDGAAPPADTPVGAPCTTDQQCGRCARCDDTTRTCAVEPVTQLFLGHRSTCYLGVGGTRWCAGENNDGQLGLGDTTDRATPERTADGDQWERLFLSYYGAATGVRQGQFYTWGNGTLAPTPSGPSRDVRAALGDLRPQCYWELDGTAPGCAGAGTTVWRSLDFGAKHTCGVRESDRTLWCWGTSYSEALGISGMADGVMVAGPTQVGTATNWETVGAGGNDIKSTGSTCALNTAGQIMCFGHPNLTGTNGVDGNATPTLISTASDWAWLDVDWEHACAGKADGSVWCWGADTYGGYVAPGQMTALVPTRIPGTFDEWLMGGHHACGRAGTRWQCMGWNKFGQLANGTTTGMGELTDLCP